MKNAYDFNSQIKHLHSIINQNVVFAEACNKYLKKMWTPLVRIAVQQLKDEYH